MHGRGLATSASMTQTVCDTIFLHSCAMQVTKSSAIEVLPTHVTLLQRWNPSSDAPPMPPSAAAVDVARGGGQAEAFVGTQLALNRKGFYAALCRIAAHMRATDPLPDAVADLLRYIALRWPSCQMLHLVTLCDVTTYCPVRATWMASLSLGVMRRTDNRSNDRILQAASGQYPSRLPSPIPPSHAQSQ